MGGDLEAAILATKRKEQLERTAGRTLKPGERIVEQVKELGFHEIAKNPFAQRELGATLNAGPKAEADARFDRIHRNAETDADRTMRDAAEEQLPARMQQRIEDAAIIRAQITEAWLQVFADASPTFDFYADKLPPTDMVARLRNFLGDLILKNDPDANEVFSTFTLLKAARENPAFRRLIKPMGELVRRGFEPAEFAELENAHVSPAEAAGYARERDDRAAILRDKYEQEAKKIGRIFSPTLWVDTLYRTIPGQSGFAPSIQKAEEEHKASPAVADRQAALELIRARLESKIGLDVVRMPWLFGDQRAKSRREAKLKSAEERVLNSVKSIKTAREQGSPQLLATEQALIDLGFSQAEMPLVENAVQTTSELDAEEKAKRKRADEIRDAFEGPKSFMGIPWNTRLWFGGPNREARAEIQKKIETEKADTMKFITERLESKMGGGMRVLNAVSFGLPLWYRKRRVLDLVKTIENADAFNEVGDLLTRAGDSMGRAITKKPAFREALERESGGGRKAVALERDPIESQDDLEYVKEKLLNERAYLKRFDAWFTSAAAKTWMISEGITDPKNLGDAEKEKVAKKFTEVEIAEQEKKMGNGYWASLFRAAHREYAKGMEEWIFKRP